MTRPQIRLLVGLVVLAAVPLIAGMLHEGFIVKLLTRILVFAIAVMSLDLLVGYGGLVCAGQAMFVGIGAYAVAIASYHLTNQAPLVLGPLQLAGSYEGLLVWPLGIGIAALTALVVGFVSLRASGMAFIMITLAFAQMIYFVILSIAVYGGDNGLQIHRSKLGLLSLEDPVAFYLVVLTAFAVVFVVVQGIVGSPFGFVLRGAMQNERRMRAVGVPTFRYQLAAFVISGAIGGLAGVLRANEDRFVSPADASFVLSGDLLIMGVLGGFGSALGPLTGAAAYVLLELVIGSYTQHWQVVFGPLIVLVVLFSKRGLTGLRWRTQS
jgi:branched-chain amino acid transport system permease protein